MGLGEVLKGSFVQREAPAAELVDVRRSTMRRMQYDLAEMTWKTLVDMGLLEKLLILF